VRAGPGLGFAILRTLAQGSSVMIACQGRGDQVAGSTVWDHLAEGGWVSDWYMDTPGVNAFSPGCATCV
jgi:uncharacterized protein YraI